MVCIEKRIEFCVVSLDRCDKFLSVQLAKYEMIIKIHKRRAGGTGFLYFHSFIYVNVYVCVLFRLSRVPWLNEKRYGPEIWCAHVPRKYLKNAFFWIFYFEKVDHEKLSCHVDFPHISSFILFSFISVISARNIVESRKT